MAPDFFAIFGGGAVLSCRAALQAHLVRLMTVSLHHRFSKKFIVIDGTHLSPALANAGLFTSLRVPYSIHLR
jgi:hypothetical protein